MGSSTSEGDGNQVSLRPVGQDNCAGAVTTQVGGLASGVMYPVGRTTNTFEDIDAARLHRVREARRPGSAYASLARCQAELKQAGRIFARLGVPVFDTTSQSIEELAARLVKMI